MSKKKTTLLSLRNQDWKNSKVKNFQKINESLTHILTSNNMDLNELIYAGAKLVSKKSGSLKEHNQKFKTWMGNQTVNTNREFSTTNENAKTEKKRENMLGRN